MTDELAALLGELEPRAERRQCLLRSVAAALILDHTGIVPVREHVDKVAQQIRLDMARQAFSAQDELGQPADRVTATENEIRTHVHDALHADHDKDFRILAVLPPAALQTYTLVVPRVDYSGALIVETVTGSNSQAKDRFLCALIYRAT